MRPEHDWLDEPERPAFEAWANDVDDVDDAIGNAELLIAACDESLSIAEMSEAVEQRSRMRVVRRREREYQLAKWELSRRRGHSAVAPRVARSRQSHRLSTGHRRSNPTRAGPSDDDGPAAPSRFPLTFACLPPEARS